MATKDDYDDESRLAAFTEQGFCELSLIDPYWKIRLEGNRVNGAITPGQQYDFDQLELVAQGWGSDIYGYIEACKVLKQKHNICTPTHSNILYDIGIHTRRLEYPTSIKSVQNSHSEITVTVRASQFRKCIRCLHHCSTVGNNVEHPKICDRCVQNIFGAGEIRTFA